jgi:NADH-quinone oxidoreductase subunit C
MSTLDEIVELVKAACTHGEPKIDENAFPKAIIIPVQDLAPVCTELTQNSATYFDMLSCLTAIDNGIEAATMEIVYNLYSIPYNIQLMVKVMLPRETPAVATVSHIWKTAGWHEREAFDMFGITFSGHTDLRRILMPADWEGHPLRKDYKHQAYYRDIKVEY